MTKHLIFRIFYSRACVTALRHHFCAASATDVSTDAALSSRFDALLNGEGYKENCVKLIYTNFVDSLAQMLMTPARLERTIAD
jgi:hypothetical protein